MNKLSVLDREMFAEAEAARLLGVAQARCTTGWTAASPHGEDLHSRSFASSRRTPDGDLGRVRRGRPAPPVPARDQRAAWPSCGRSSSSSAKRTASLTRWRTGARTSADRQLVLEAQEEAGLSGRLLPGRGVRGQTILTPPPVGRLAAPSSLGRRPRRGVASPRGPPLPRPHGARRALRPLPLIKRRQHLGLVEHSEAGEDVDEIADAFDLDLGDVRWALAYETSARASCTRPAKPATVRFYVDADVLGLAKILVQVRNDVTYPGDPGGVLHKRERPPSPIASTGVLDTDWIPTVAAHGWLIITRDSNIGARRAEIAAVRDNGGRMVALAGAEAIGTWAQLEVLLSQWRRVEAQLARPGPFIYSVTRTKLREIDLNKPS